MKIKILALSLILLISAAGCNSLPTAPRINGKPIVIKVVVEDNIQKDMDSMQVQRYSQVASWMAKSLLEFLQSSGYQTQLIPKKSDYKYSAGVYLLEVKVERYNFRAVGTFLETSYVLTGKKQLYSNKHSCSTARNWRHCVRKLNKDMVEDITKKFMEIEAKK